MKKILIILILSFMMNCASTEQPKTSTEQPKTSTEQPKTENNNPILNIVKGLEKITLPKF
jgi:biopolymer transport protein ExbD